jgi:hypothetical protein
MNDDDLDDNKPDDYFQTAIDEISYDSLLACSCDNCWYDQNDVELGDD